METRRKVGGSWDFSDDELPITQYFNARQAVLLHDHFFREEGDLFKVPHHLPTKGLVEEAKVGGGRRRKAPRAVDEDLYKIPEEFLSRKKKKGTMVGDLLRRCLGLMCV